MASTFQPDRGWSWLILFAAFYSNVTFDGIIFSFGVFFVEYLDEFEAGHAQTAWIGSVISGTYAVVGPLAGLLANRFGCRAVTIVGALIATSGFILASFSHNIWLMIFAYGFLGGVGFGFMYLCSYVMVGYYFEKHRALATGINSCGSGIGAFIFAPLSATLIDTFTWKGALWIISGFILNGVVAGALYRPVDKTKSDGLAGTEDQNNLLHVKLLCYPVFLILCIASFLCMIGFFVPFMYLPDYAQHIGLTRTEGAILVSIIGITNTVGRVTLGFLADRPWADPLKIRNTAMMVGGAATMACSLIHNFPLLCVYAAIFGTCVASYVSLTAILLVEFLGLENLSTSFGFLNMFRGVATFIGAPLAGFMLDKRGQYDVPFYIAGAAIALAGTICIPLRYIQTCKCTEKRLNGGGTQEKTEEIMTFKVTSEDSGDV